MKKILSNSPFCHTIGALLLASYLYFFSHIHPLPTTVKNSMVLVIICYFATAIIVPKISRYRLVPRKFYVMPVLTMMYAITVAAIAILRIEYSRVILAHAFAVSMIILYIITLMQYKHKRLTMLAINNFDLESFANYSNIELKKIEFPAEIDAIKSGLVVDLHKPLSAEQAKFVADCSIAHIPVFHSESIRELMEGKVQTAHLSENSQGSLLPSPIYLWIKQVWESLLIICSFPITLPIMLITAILIKLESPGPVMFIQERIGQGGKAFRIYKFRSMATQKGRCKSKFATQEQARVTKIGRVIRKVRIDELPQFFNVLKGDMSLIGPRPEQEDFVREFEKTIPFYGYRHMVKPGITGWAQTVQGYADDTDSTKEKLAHDLFYIKHLSFWLDINIVMKTIKTMLTGFGAK